MSNSIDFSAQTSVEEILNWDFQKQCTLYIRKSSGFEPGAEGFALSALSAVAQNACKLEIDFGFPEPQSVSELFDTPLASAFGYSVSRLASLITFEGRLPKTARFRQLQADLYTAQGGRIYRGNYCGFICADPQRSIPPILESKDSPSGEFPAPSAITKVLRSSLTEMGMGGHLESSKESPLRTLVYETFLNSFEHGRSPVLSQRGIRCLILEKVMLDRKSLSQRRLSRQIKEYLARILDEPGSGLGTGVICITVADQGSGIQNTLPVRHSEDRVVAPETAAERFVRAFKGGESRKPQGEVERGLGLERAIAALFDLNAMITICSGSLFYQQDFSTGEYKYPGVVLDLVRELPRAERMGTTLSLYIPVLGVSPDQQRLHLA